ncbi:hypothetical protein FB45DRAFT_886793 [Roridomyces roridus]|uniref:Uncharacterized protein n=1 Tax=Roridomyces roridus TaxID=1738132 RepID=A0AAD7G255_9AGAR|nr:hypothetical protein FB45DRAFT_886793 [Roridomyces roridus]
MADIAPQDRVYWLSCLASLLQDTRESEPLFPSRNQAIPRNSRGHNHLATLLSRESVNFEPSPDVAVATAFRRNVFQICVFASTRNSPNTSSSRRSKEYFIPSEPAEKDVKRLELLLAGPDSYLQSRKSTSFTDYAYKTMRLMTAAAAHILKNPQSQAYILRCVAVYFMHHCRAKCKLASTWCPASFQTWKFSRRGLRRLQTTWPHCASRCRTVWLQDF